MFGRLNAAQRFKEVAMRPFQIIFNPTSAVELAKMPKELQLHILGEFRGLPQEVMKTDLERFGKLERNGRTLRSLLLMAGCSRI